MPTEVRFEFFGDAQVDRSLEGLEARGRDLAPAWEQIADRFVEAEKAQFSSQGEWGSGGWQPLSPRYAAWKARHYPGATILVRTRELLRSLTQGPEVRIIEPHDMWIGSRVRYGAYHQRGGRHLPRRPPGDLPESERVGWVRVVHEWLIKGDT